jgi:hypothetical protein
LKALWSRPVITHIIIHIIIHIVVIVHIVIAVRLGFLIHIWVYNIHSILQIMGVKTMSSG